jgi:hypothetical protein
MIKWIKNIFKKVESDIKLDISESKKEADLIGAYIISIERKYNEAVTKYESEISDLKAKLKAIENFINSETKIAELPETSAVIAEKAVGMSKP